MRQFVANEQFDTRNQVFHPALESIEKIGEKTVMFFNLLDHY